MGKGDAEKAAFDEALQKAQDEWAGKYEENLKNTVHLVYNELLPKLKSKLLELGTVLDGEEYEDAVSKILGEIDPKRKKPTNEDKGKSKK
jgi:hypothetical protein